MPLFDAIIPVSSVFNYDVSPDGQRFLVASMGAIGNTSPPLTVVKNWQVGLRK